MAPVLYLATADGPLIVERRGESWAAARPLDVGDATGVAADPQRPERVVVATGHGGAWASDDGGASWRRVFRGVPHDRLWSVAVAGAERVDGRAVVYLGSEPSRVFRSEDGGGAWREREGLDDLPSAGDWSFPPRPATHHVRWIEPDPHAAGRIFVAVEAGALVRGEGGGATWRDRVPGAPRDTHQLATHPDAPGRLWAAAGDGFFESSDGGDTWRAAERGLAHRYAWSVALSTGDPGVAVLSAAASARRAHDAERAEAHLYRRAADGEAWCEATRGLPDPAGTRAWALAADPAEGGVFFAGSSGALYRSADGGASWERLAVDWPEGYAGGRIRVLVAAG